MRRPHPVARAAAAVLLVGWSTGVVAPAPGFAAEDEANAPAAEEGAATPAAEEGAAAPAVKDETAPDQPAPVPAEPQWYDATIRNANVGVDLLLVRPLAGVTLIAGSVLFVPAAIMTAPNGWDSVKEAYNRFIDEPVDYFASRPLGEF